MFYFLFCATTTDGFKSNEKRARSKSEYFLFWESELFWEVWSVSEGYSTVQKSGGQGRNHDGIGSSRIMWRTKGMMKETLKDTGSLP